jgi:MoaA/NifB/PqqE/SkfB family radical SAM enzyme
MLPLRNLRRFFAKSLRQPGYAFRVLCARIRAYGYYYTGKGLSAAPESITLFLTHRCNLQCKMCGQWGEHGVTRQHELEVIRKELSIERILALADELAPARPSVTLFGGEPLLYTHCVKLIGEIKRRGMHTVLISNGSLLAPHAQSIVDAGLDELNVSLDGNGALHDEIRGMRGLFESIMQGLINIQAAKRTARARTPLVNIQCTISRHNFRHLEQMIDVATRAGADSLTFHHLIFTDDDVLRRQQSVDALLRSSSEAWKGFSSDHGIDVDELIGILTRIRTARSSCAIDVYPNLSAQGIREYYAHASRVPRGYTGACLSPWLAGYVFPDGTVRPCLNSSFIFGSLHTHSFMDVWNGVDARRYRNLLKQHKIFPACTRCTELYRY